MRISSRYVLPLFLLVVFVGPVILGPLFYAVVEGFGVPFHRAMNRALMVSALAALFLFRHRLRLREWWRTEGIALRHLAIGIAAAMGSSLVMIVLYGIFCGFRSAGLSPGHAALSVLLALIAALIVPIFEETIFRGFLVTALVETTGRRLGCFFAALIFALAHFLKVPATFNGHDIHFWSGATGMAAAVIQLGQGDFVSGRGLNLFLVGLILGGVFLRTRMLWMGAGLHGGWILMLMSFTALTRPANIPRIAGLGGDLLSSPITSAMLFCTGVILWRFLPQAKSNE